MRKPNQTENEISPTFSNFVPAISKRVSTQFERQLPEIIHVNIDEKHKIRYKRGYGGFPDRADVVWLNRFETVWDHLSSYLVNRLDF